MSASINPVQSAQAFIQIYDNDPDVVSHNAKLLGSKIGSYLKAPFTYIPVSFYLLGKRIVGELKPNIPQETGAVFLTSESIIDFEFRMDPLASTQLRENFATIFDCMKKDPRFKHISILYKPVESNFLNMDPVTSYANGQIIFNSALANLTKEETRWALYHELSHYIHKDGWVSDIYNVCGTAASIALYFNHSFLAFSIAQMALNKGLTELCQYFEYRADKYGVQLLNDNKGAISYFTKSMVIQSAMCLQHSKSQEIYGELSLQEQGKVMRHIAKNYRVEFAPSHPSSWDRCQEVELLRCSPDRSTDIPKF